jgi:Flp pilus assembly protein CpaB
MNKKPLVIAAVLLFPLALAPLAALAEKAVSLAAGYRAMSVPLPAHQLRFVAPGDRVDVMTTFEAEFGKKGEKERENVTATILQNVRVLAVDRKDGVISLELNPNEAQYAALFAAKDKALWLIKRDPSDKEMHPMEMASAKKLFR